MIIDQEPPNIYELPTCPICLNSLVQDINCLSCGHSFHYICITQHFQYKGSCPSCQKRATIKELRRVVYRPIPLKDIGEKHLDKLMNEMQQSETKPFQYMVSQVRKYAQINDKLQKQNKKYEQKLEYKSIQHEQDLKKIQQKQNDNKKLKEQNKALMKNITMLNERVISQQQTVIQQKQTIQQLRQKEKEFIEIQKYKRWVNQTNEELSKYYAELSTNGTSYEDIAQIFFNLTMLKTLQLAKIKLNKEQNSEQLQKKQRQNLRLNTHIQKLKKQKDMIQKEKIQESKKYQQLKTKYRSLRDKVKCINQNKSSNIELELSNGYDSKKSQPAITEQIQRPILKKYQKVPLSKPEEQDKNQLQLKYGGFSFKNAKTTNTLKFVTKR